jgi:hypothetical protein
LDQSLLFLQDPPMMSLKKHEIHIQGEDVYYHDA